MKNSLLKTIVMMVMAFVAMSANAQVCENANEQVCKKGINASDLVVCREYLNAHPTDVIVSKKEIPDGIVISKVFISDGKMVIKNDTVFYDVREVERVIVNQATIVKLDSLSVVANFNRGLYDEEEQYDIISDYSPEVAEYRNFLEGGSCSFAGRIPVKGARKYGWAARVHAGTSWADENYGFLFGAGLMYDRKYFGVNVNAEVGQSWYSSSAENSGDDYWVFRTESVLMLQPFHFDSNNRNQNRLWFFGGIGFESFETDSPSGENGYLRSKGNYLYSTFGLDFEHRFFATGNSLGFRAQWRDTKAVVQNRGYENFGSIVLSAYFKFGFSRNKFNYKK